MTGEAIIGGYVGVWRGGREPKDPNRHWWNKLWRKPKKTEAQLLEEAAERRRKAEANAARRRR